MWHDRPWQSTESIWRHDRGPVTCRYRQCKPMRQFRDNRPATTGSDRRWPRAGSGPAVARAGHATFRSSRRVIGAASLAFGDCLQSGGVRGGVGQQDAHQQATRRGRVKRHLAAMAFSDLLYDRQTQAASPLGLLGQAYEAVEDSHTLVLWDPGTVILDLEDHFACVLRGGRSDGYAGSGGAVSKSPI